jgi:hypothetical protein
VAGGVLGYFDDGLAKSIPLNLGIVWHGEVSHGLD